MDKIIVLKIPLLKKVLYDNKKGLIGIVEKSKETVFLGAPTLKIWNKVGILPIKEHRDFYKEYKKVLEELNSLCKKDSYIQAIKIPFMISDYSSKMSNFQAIPYNEYKLR